jgi:hypothetical protein
MEPLRVHGKQKEHFLITAKSFGHIGDLFGLKSMGSTEKIRKIYM